MTARPPAEVALETAIRDLLHDLVGWIQPALLVTQLRERGQEPGLTEGELSDMYLSKAPRLAARQEAVSLALKAWENGRP